MMLEIGPKSRMKKEELTNRNSHVIKLFKCDLLIFSLENLRPISSIVDIGLKAEIGLRIED